MNSEVKKMWIEALRSGEFEQTGGALRDGNKYCCLGVLCELHRRSTDSGKWEDYRPTATVQYTCGTGTAGKEISEEGILPVPVSEWAGIEDCATDPFIEESRANLSTLNDRGMTFPDIADIIEAHL